MVIKIKRVEGIVELCTDQSAYADWEMAKNALEEARSGAGAGRMAGDPTLELAKAVQATEGPMSEATIVFRLRALPRRRWQEFVSEYPAREDNENDGYLGVDQSRFFDAVMSEVGTTVSVNEKISGKVVDFDPADWNDLADEMSDGQWGAFASKLMELNRGVTEAPKLRIASRVIQNSEEN